MELIGYLIIVAVLVVFFAVNSVRYSREKEQQLMKRIKNSYGKRCEKDYKPGEFEKIRHYFEYLVENGILEDYIGGIASGSKCRRNRKCDCCGNVNERADERY